MTVNKALEQLPREGFLKVPRRGKVDLSKEDKVKLVRRGNTYFQEGRIEEARRIFITAHNTDGLIRTGDYYRDHGRPYEAVKMYRLAPAPDRMEEMAVQMANALEVWLQASPEGSPLSPTSAPE